MILSGNNYWWTSTIALTNVTMPYALQIANKGFEKGCIENGALLKGANVMNGAVTYKEVADAHGMQYQRVQDVLRMNTVF